MGHIDMAELRRFHRSIVDRGNNGVDEDDDDVFEHPLDIDDQEELIQKFEEGNTRKNRLYVNILTGLSTVCAIPFFNQTWTFTGKGRWFSGVSCVSIALSIINLRCGIMTEFQNFNPFNLRMNDVIIERVNILVLILAELLSVTSELSLKVISQVPLVLFTVSFLTKRWIVSMESEISNLRRKKYKYKGA